MPRESGRKEKSNHYSDDWIIRDYMIDKISKYRCCGCTACCNICPQKCIYMNEDSEGFLYPIINREHCISCNLCEAVCPIHKTNSNLKSNPQSLIVRIRDDKILQDSTSGGAFTAFTEKFITEGAIVYGASFSESFRVIHSEAITLNDLQKFRGSKFVQSYLGDTFIKIREYLEYGRAIVFSGAPCQVAGLKRFLRKDYEKLYCIDFVCRGVTSPKLWREYLSYIQLKRGSGIVSIKFRNKTYGYHSPTMLITFKNGSKYSESGRIDYMMKSFVSEICSRPSCSNCEFKTINRESDITLFDCKNFSNIMNMKDDDKGYTSVFLQSDKGKVMFEKAKDNLISFKADIDKMINYDGIMVCNSATPNSNREEFYNLLGNVPLPEVIRKTIPVVLKDVLLENSKRFLYVTGLLRHIRKIKKKHMININK